MYQDDNTQPGGNSTTEVKEYIEDEPLIVAYPQGELATATFKPDPAMRLEPPARNIFAKWLKVLTRPSVATFASEMPDANWGTTLLGVLIFAVVYTLIIGITLVSKGEINTGRAPAEIIFYIYIAIAPLFVAWLLYRISKAEGKGIGDFATEAYLCSLYTVPLGILVTLLGLVSGVVGIALFAVVIYWLFLTYYMVQATQQLRAATARAVVLLTFIFAIIFFIFGAFVLSLIILPGF